MCSQPGLRVQKSFSFQVGNGTPAAAQSGHNRQCTTVLGKKESRDWSPDLALKGSGWQQWRDETHVVHVFHC